MNIASRVAKEIVIQGVPISRGIALGKPFFFTSPSEEPPEFFVSPNAIEREILRYQRAVAASREDILRIQKKLKEEQIGEGAEILDAHLQIMQDPLLTIAVETEIRHTRKNAEYVFESLMKKYQKRFQSINDPFFRERFKDIQDISRRVSGYLRQSVRVSLADIPPGSVVIADDLSALDAAEANESDIAAFITRGGGATSHAAIVAKAKGIPFVCNANIDPYTVDSEQTLLIIDGRTGEIIINPSEETKRKFHTIRGEMALHFEKMQKDRLLQAETYDGYCIRLSANLEMVNDLELIQLYGGHGIGLFRSEYLFLSNEEFPSEEAQYQIYKKIVQKLEGMPIVIRTFDIGGDKQLSVSGNSPVVLSSRSLRILLDERSIFKAQLRAILRAAVEGEVSILLPMVSGLSELMRAKELLHEAQEELEGLGIDHAKKIPIGCMIEVPSAAIISDLLARESDFLSIGTNDLVQYSLAIDRGDREMQKYDSPTHPSVIRLIKMVVAEANHHGIPVSVCGEIASDPRFTPLLLGLGVHELSLASRLIPTIKHAVRNTSIVAASHLAERVLTLSNSEEIMELLTEEYRNNVPEDCFFNC